MKICHFTYTFFPLIGGLEEFVHNLSLELMNREISVCVLTPHVKRHEYDDSMSPYPVHRCCKAISRSHFAQQLLYPLYKCFKKERFDLIHVHDAYPCGYVAYLFAKMFHVPYVITSHGGDISEVSPGVVKSKRITARIGAAYRGASGLTAISGDMREKMLRLGAVDENLTTIFNGVDVGAFAPESEYFDRDHPYIFYLGSLVRRKGVDLLLKAFAKVADCHPEVELVIAGKGEQKGSLVGLAEELNLAGRVTFHGVTMGDEKIRMFQNCRFFVCPSRYEPFGIVNIEALASGVPVVAANTGGLPDIIKNDYNGLLCQPENPDSLADAMQRLLSSPEKRLQLSENALVSAKAFDWGKVASEYLSVYEGSLERFAGRKM